MYWAKRTMSGRSIPIWNIRKKLPCPTHTRARVTVCASGCNRYAVPRVKNGKARGLKRTDSERGAAAHLRRSPTLFFFLHRHTPLRAGNLKIAILERRRARRNFPRQHLAHARLELHGTFLRAAAQDH